MFSHAKHLSRYVLTDIAKLELSMKTELDFRIWEMMESTCIAANWQSQVL